MSSVAVEEGDLIDTSSEVVDLDLLNEEELLRTPPGEEETKRLALLHPAEPKPTQGSEINSTNGLEMKMSLELPEEVDSTTKEDALEISSSGDDPVTSTEGKETKTAGEAVIEKTNECQPLEESMFEPISIKVFSMGNKNEEFTNRQMNKLPENLLLEFDKAERNETDTNGGEAYKCVKQILNRKGPEMSSFEKLTSISDVSIIPLASGDKEPDGKEDGAKKEDKIKWSIMKNKKEMRPKRAVAMLVPKPTPPPCQPELLHPLKILRVPQYAEEKKQATASLRPTALVNPFPPFPADTGVKASQNVEGHSPTAVVADSSARILNGTSAPSAPWPTNEESVKEKKRLISPRPSKQQKNRPMQTSILDYTKPLMSQVAKAPQAASKRPKKALKTVIDQLGAKNAQEANMIQHLLNAAPPETICVTNALGGSGGAVSIAQEPKTITDPSVVDRLKRLGTVIELEENAELIEKETNSLALLEKMTINKPQSPVITALEDRPVFQNKDISVFTNVHQAKRPQPIPEPVLQVTCTTVQMSTPEPNLLEPVIDIVEDLSLSYDGKFVFKMESFFVDLPNETKVYSCDICSAVYHHSHMLKKHYLRLHIARKYIPDREMEVYNIQPEAVQEEAGERLLFRCHTCRQCLPTRNDLKSHLMDHPPLTELSKQVRGLKNYKCESCSMTFKWRKVYVRHKKTCKPGQRNDERKEDSPSSPIAKKEDENPDLVKIKSVYNFSDEASNNPTTIVEDEQKKEKTKSPTPDTTMIIAANLHHCLYCNETFLTAGKKRNHILSAHPYLRRSHKCAFCKKDYTSNQSLFTHLLDDHPMKYFGCLSCKERFLNLPELKKHMDVKHNLEKDEMALLSRRTSSLIQEKDHFLCDSCSRIFLIEGCFKGHKCVPEKPPKPPKIKKSKPFERVEKTEKRVDAETIFYSQVSLNVRENLMHHLDGKLDTTEDSVENEPMPPSRTFLNFSAGFNQRLAEEPEVVNRTKVPWEKYSFPKTYDGRCGLTSYIKDMSYLDISTQLIMRKNLQNLESSPSKEQFGEDVPTVLALERLGAKCAESYGQVNAEQEEHTLGELSGEWVRDRTYICSVCKWETPCLWTMEDHKYEAHPGIHCPQHELVGDQKTLSYTIYTRLAPVEAPFKGPSLPTPEPIADIKCTKCGADGFQTRGELHVHILACAGVVVQPWLPTPKKKKWKKKRRGRRGLKRNIPSTPHRPVKLRSKPGDTDSIQKMIANLPPKRLTRRVVGFDEMDLKTRSQSTIQNVPPPPTVQKQQQQLQKAKGNKISLKPKEEKDPSIPVKETDLIDTSAERGDVLSSLRMMPVTTPREELLEPRQILDKVLGVKRDENSPGLPCAGCGEVFESKVSLRKHHKSCAYFRECGQVTEHRCKTCSRSFSYLLALIEHSCDEMPKLEIEKDMAPVNSSEIPVLVPEAKKVDKKEDTGDLICGISFVDGLIKYETLSSISQETDNLQSDDSSRSKKRKVTTEADSNIKKRRTRKTLDSGKVPNGPVRRSQVDRNLDEKSEQEERQKDEVENEKQDRMEEEEEEKEEEKEEEEEEKKKLEIKTEKKKKTQKKKPARKKEVRRRVEGEPSQMPDGAKTISKKKEQRKTVKAIDESQKKRGRPFGAKTKRKGEQPERRSARNSRQNGEPTLETAQPVEAQVQPLPQPVLTAMLYSTEDEIVPFEEVPKPRQRPLSPKPVVKRKPRKRDESPDRTTIVVQVEVHPEPAKRKHAEAEPDDDDVRKRVKLEEQTEIIEDTDADGDAEVVSSQLPDVIIKEEPSEDPTVIEIKEEPPDDDDRPDDPDGPQSQDKAKRKKKLKKKKTLIQKMKMLKKKRKAKKAHGSVKEVVKIAGFSWEVSELANSPPKPEPSYDWPPSDSWLQVPPYIEPRPPSPSTSSTALAIPSLPVLEQQTPSLGTIIDSVNKLLNEPESTYLPLGLPQYSLADLQRAMGASDAEMAVLQQLGEASCLQEEIDDKSTLQLPEEEWGETCIMDLDNQPQQQPVVSSSVVEPQNEESPSAVPNSFYKPRNFLRDEPKNPLCRRPPSPRLSSSTSLLAAYNGKEVVCPSCSSHFMGFQALQKHVNTVHASQDTAHGGKKGLAGTNKLDLTAALTRRVVLNSVGSRLVCYECLQILPSNIMSAHLENDHQLDPSDISKCSTVSGDPINGPVGGERLKSKMSSALGDLLDKAVNNLLSAKIKHENPLTGGAVELLTRLCSVRRREGTGKHSTRELFMRLKMGEKQEPNMDDVSLKPTVSRPFSCTICGQKFSLASSRNKHEVLAHRTFCQHEEFSSVYNDFEEYDNDWREAPSPTGSTSEGNTEHEWNPTCSDCGLSFTTLHELMKHRIEDHSRNRRPSIEGTSSSSSSTAPMCRTLERSVSLDSPPIGDLLPKDRRPAAKRSRGRTQKKATVGPMVRAKAEAALRQLNVPRKKQLPVVLQSPPAAGEISNTCILKMEKNE
ncbi:uncharacterized protein LOC106663048 isoform X1 [Cimex lectularius]|uniref:C2H2-type domain-containing protein n=1 Tax=Cimex lectularius TaxID=79782 RepID=A0A8I6RBM1_CIMLE|nr:uncharacterized protein LOC106663048 isoform X1 [Cimex lectularius]XP_014243057.1 uncharacterized protein LOC106663048 isoform X1 [Cimex lectularius]XP_014243058.1 uncharacterized protein LOC106663048 isoform X1 [Cimex lectularius]XP_014243059.1 uncharacterized protein LOC106663048 isoform X1 [Cimex lectularius]XP_024082654.1 uncharacterized protein LOC106663048 isoform X1 [Cimex lectularius]